MKTGLLVFFSFCWVAVGQPCVARVAPLKRSKLLLIAPPEVLSSFVVHRFGPKPVCKTAIANADHSNSKNEKNYPNKKVNITTKDFVSRVVSSPFITFPTRIVTAFDVITTALGFSNLHLSRTSHWSFIKGTRWWSWHLLS